MSKTDTPSFTLDLQTRPVVIDEEKYTLTELTGKLRDKYLQSLAGRLKTTGTGKAATQELKNLDGPSKGSACDGSRIM